MVRQIIPVVKTTEDDDKVTYTWGHPGDEKVTTIIKATLQVEPGPGTTMDQSLFLYDWLQRVRQFNELAGWPDKAPRPG